jgi:hypothetical protein
MEQQDNSEVSISDFWSGKLDRKKLERNNYYACHATTLAHFFMVCYTCNHTICCLYIALDDHCRRCENYFGSHSEVIKTQMFTKDIPNHNCFLTIPKPISNYDSTLKNILINPNIQKIIKK